MSKIVISVIYVNYNTQKLLEDSLLSLVNNLKNVNYEVIVIDNASQSFNQESLKAIYPKVKSILLDENIGFGKGNNLGAKHAQGKYLWFLNTDTLVPKNNNITELIKYLDLNREYAAASPLLKNSIGVIQGAQVAKLPSVIRIVVEKPVGILQKVLPISNSWLDSYSPGYTPTRDCDVEQAVAAALIIRSSTFQQIKGFSKEYFMYYEDTDLCKKIASIGLKIRFFASANIIHLQGKSIKSNYTRKHYYYQSQDIYFAKWHNRAQVYLMKLLRLPLKLYYKVRT